jgi:CDP-diacylglycerol--glycerol-3-phosphate 3-phosphatidyltransferase
VTILPTRLPKGMQDGIGRSVGRLGITPNMISMFGFAGNLAAAWLIRQDRLLVAVIVYAFLSALDLVDGAVARATGLASPFGAVFDAILDRASEAIVLAACGWYFSERGEEVQAAFAYLAIFGSIAVSYMRARAEVVGLAMRDGLFRRQERVGLLTLGLLFNGLTIVIAALALLANFTALQRFWMLRTGIRD